MIEDDDGHARLVEKNLCRSSLCDKLIRVNNGQDGLNIIHGRNSNPHWNRSKELLVLLDLNMPVLDGYSLLQTIKNNPETRAIPVIVMTTTSDAQEIKHCYDMGCNLYLTKPVDYTKFQQMIHALGEFLKVVSVPVGNQ